MDQPSPVPTPQPETATPSSMSLGGRLLNVFAAPGEVFEEMKAAPVAARNWLVPALLLIVVGWVAGWLILSQDALQQQVREITDRAIQERMDKAHIPAEQAEQIRAVAEKWQLIVQKVGVIVAPVATAFASPFLWGLVFWVIGAQVFKGKFSYLKAVECAGVINMIAVLEAIVKTLLILATVNIAASPSLMLLVKGYDPQNPAHQALGAVNIMTFWLLAVRALGLARLSGASFAKAAAWIFGLWAAYAGFFIGLSAVMVAFSHRVSGH